MPDFIERSKARLIDSCKTRLDENLYFYNRYAKPTVPYKNPHEHRIPIEPIVRDARYIGFESLNEFTDDFKSLLLKSEILTMLALFELAKLALLATVLAVQLVTFLFTWDISDTLDTLADMADAFIFGAIILPLFSGGESILQLGSFIMRSVFWVAGIQAEHPREHEPTPVEGDFFKRNKDRLMSSFGERKDIATELYNRYAHPSEPLVHDLNWWHPISHEARYYGFRSKAECLDDVKSLFIKPALLLMLAAFEVAKLSVFYPSVILAQVVTLFFTWDLSDLLDTVVDAADAAAASVALTTAATVETGLQVGSIFMRAGYTAIGQYEEAAPASAGATPAAP